MIVKRHVALVLALASTFIAADAAAQSADTDKSVQLFKEGTDALDERRFSIACPKLAESHQLEPKALGTLVNLARCNEEWGKTATAYAQYIELEKGATERKQPERVALAKKHKAALETKLSNIAVKFQAPVAGETVKIDDGAPVDAATLGATQLFDPGDHAIEASAPGKTTYQSKFTVAPGPSTADEIVPALKDVAVAATTTQTMTTSEPPPPPPPPAESKWSTQKKLGVVGIGVGAASIVVGAITGIIAIGGKSSIKDKCPTTCGGQNLQDANGDYSSAHTAATVSTITFIAGGVVAAAGAVLFFTAPNGEKVQVAPAVGSSSAGLLLGGSF